MAPTRAAAALMAVVAAIAGWTPWVGAVLPDKRPDVFGAPLTDS